MAGAVLGGATSTAVASPDATSSVVASGASSCANAAPCNDSYLNSLSLNSPGTKLDRIHTLQDVRDTSSATVQTNIFNPCGMASCPTGPPEVTSCGRVRYGNTVWYDFHPDADGSASIRTSGFDNVITLYSFNPRSLLPDATHRQCVHTGSFPSEQLFTKVKKGSAYTFQIGGVVGSSGLAASGPLEMQFDYSIQPARSLKADATLTARATPSGITIIGLSVTAGHRGARVEVDCPHHCASEKRTIPKHGSTTVGFRGLAGLVLPAGAQIVIRVIAPHMIGAAIEYNILAGNLTKNQFCTEPGSRKLRRTCH